MILAGASMKLVSPPIGLYQIHWFNLVLAFWALRKGDDKRNAQLMEQLAQQVIANLSHLEVQEVTS